MHIITNMGDTLTAGEVDIFINNFLSYGIISQTQGKLLKAATSDNVLVIPNDIRDYLRANIFKNMLINLI